MFVSCNRRHTVRLAACGKSQALQLGPCASEELARTHTIPWHGSSSRGGRSDLDPRRGEECIGSRPSVRILIPEQFGCRFGPLGRFRQSWRSKYSTPARASAVWPRSARSAGAVSARSADRYPCAARRNASRALASRESSGSRNLLSRRIVGIGLGENLDDRSAVRSWLESGKVEDANGCRPYDV